MRYLLWTLKIIFFLFLLSFSLQNTDIVTLNAFLGYYWRAPLIFIMLACFVVGAVFGILSSLIYIIQLRRELIIIRKELKNKSSTVSSPTELILEPPRDAL